MNNEEKILEILTAMQADISDLKAGQIETTECLDKLDAGQLKLEVGQTKLELGQKRIEKDVKKIKDDVRSLYRLSEEAFKDIGMLDQRTASK